MALYDVLESHIDSRRLHHYRFDSTFLQLARHPMKVCGETAELSYGFCIPV
jgi:hypothetical protein